MEKSLSKKIYSWLIGLLSITALSISGQPTSASGVQDKLNILTLGDSRVEGARPHFESYRFEFWKLMVEDGRTIDMIGPLKDEARYPTLKGQAFDRDHAGVGGFRTTDVLENLEDALEEIETPNVVLLGIGGNDLLGSQTPVAKVLGNLQEIIRMLQADNPNAVIFVEQIAPGVSSVMRRRFQERFDAFNMAIPDLASSMSTSASRVIAVDMRTNWSETFLADEVHYNKAGARHVAEKYFDAFVRHMRLPEQSFDNVSNATPATGIAAGLQPVVHIENRPPDFMSLKERMAVHNVPGVSIAVMQNDTIVLTHVEGVRDTVSNAPVNADTIFQAASISKPAFATILMRYRERHGLELDANINDQLASWQLPEHKWQDTQDVTLRQLLSHTAGTTVHGFPGYAAGENVPTLVQLLNGARPTNTAAIEVDLQPGTAFRYSGGGTSAAQLVLEDVSGRKLTSMAGEYLFAPLGITRSVFAQPLPAAFQDNAAVPYDGHGASIAGGAHTYAALAAAGLWTTPSDILKWAASVRKAHAGETGQIVSPDSARDMLSNPLGPVGIGFFIDDAGGALSFGHGGSNAGFRSNFFVYTDSGDGIAVMTNGANGSILIREIIHRAAKIYSWDDVQPVVKQVIKLDTDALSQFAGQYRVTEPLVVEASLTVDDDSLILNAGEMVIDERFFPEGPAKFFALNSSDLVFTTDNDGTVTGFEYRGFVKATKVD